MTSVLLLAPLVMTGDTLPSTILCPFRRLTGWICPLCGLTRALLAAGRGRWLASFGFHPLGPLLWLILPGAFLASGACWILGRPRPRTTPLHAAIAASALLLIWIARLVVGAGAGAGSL